MDPGIMTILSSIGGRLVNYGFGLLTAPKHLSTQTRIRHLDQLIQAIPNGELVDMPPSPQIATRAPVSSKEKHLTSTATVALPTTEETVKELKRRLGKELYRLEMDLQGGARFAGKPCDCLEHKHKLGLEATAEELMSYETDTVYGEVMIWLSTHEYPPEEILKHPPEYFQKLAPELRQFRKRLMGTESTAALVKEVDDEKVSATQEQETETEA